MLRFIPHPVLVVFLLLALGASARAGHASESLIVHVKKTATCGCCVAWVEHMERAGFSLEVRDVSQDALEAFKHSMGIAKRYRSCHTARVGGYVIEGHVDAREIARLLAERPDAIGLAVPGMPLGSPGMDFGKHRHHYETLLLEGDGTARVYEVHE